MSEIKVDTLTGKTTANDITVTAGATATMSLEQGLCKVWATYQQEGSTVVHDSHNVSSMTDGGTGKAQVNINNNMNNDDYCVAIGAEDGSGENDSRACHRDFGLTRSSSAFGYLTMGENGVKNDFQRSCPMFMGDLA